MRVVITGGAGFIGSHLVDRFLRDGHEVVAIDNLCTGAPANLDDAVENARLTFVRADATAGLPVQGHVDAVLHFASPASPVHYARLALETLAVNSTGTAHACDLAERTGARLIFASTSEIYGEPAVHPQPESYWGNVNPVGERACYDEGKRFGEALIATRVRLRALDGRIVRIFNTYGPRMAADDGRAIPNFIAQALAGRALTLYGDGSQTRSFTYIDDLVDGIARLTAHEQARGAIVNLGNPEEVTITAVAGTIAAAAAWHCASSTDRFPQTIRRAANPTSRAHASCLAGNRRPRYARASSARWHGGAARVPPVLSA